MSELDLDQKVGARRLLWRMGYSTRIDVVLRAVELAGHGRGAPEAYTDLDVLGVEVTASGDVQSCIVDCKTGNSSVIGRMFWVRGLVELFGADTAFMVRDQAISGDAQQLASRLGISALTQGDLSTLDGMLQTSVPLTTAPLSILFEAEKVKATMARFTGMDRRLKPLLDYRQFAYWVHEDHRNLVGIPDTLKDLQDVLDPKNPLHVGLVLDSAWLYLLSIARAIGAIRTSHVAHLDHGLSQYIAGGAVQLSQKRELADLLTSLQKTGEIPTGPTASVDPPFFDGLLELVVRLLRRGRLLNEALRVLEYQTAASVLNVKASAAEAFGAEYDRTAAKLALDVVIFIVTAANLDEAFIAGSRTSLMDASAATAAENPLD